MVLAAPDDPVLQAINHRLNVTDQSIATLSAGQAALGTHLETLSKHFGKLKAEVDANATAAANAQDSISDGTRKAALLADQALDVAKGAWAELNQHIGQYAADQKDALSRSRGSDEKLAQVEAHQRTQLEQLHRRMDDHGARLQGLEGRVIPETMAPLDGAAGGAPMAIDSDGQASVNPESMHWTATHRTDEVPSLPSEEFMPVHYDEDTKTYVRYTLTDAYEESFWVAPSLYHLIPIYWVPEGWNQPPFFAKDIDGRLFMRGCCCPAYKTLASITNPPSTMYLVCHGESMGGIVTRLCVNFPYGDLRDLVSGSAPNPNLYNAKTGKNFPMPDAWKRFKGVYAVPDHNPATGLRMLVGAYFGPGIYGCTTVVQSLENYISFAASRDPPIPPFYPNCPAPDLNRPAGPDGYAALLPSTMGSIGYGLQPPPRGGDPASSTTSRKPPATSPTPASAPPAGAVSTTSGLATHPQPQSQSAPGQTPATFAQVTASSPHLGQQLAGVLPQLQSLLSTLQPLQAMAAPPTSASLSAAGAPSSSAGLSAAGAPRRNARDDRTRTDSTRGRSGRDRGAAHRAGTPNNRQPNPGGKRSGSGGGSINPKFC